MPLTPIAVYQVNSAASDTTSLVTPSFTPAVGEVIVVTAFTEDSAFVMGTVTGGSSAWTSRYSNSATSNCSTFAWTTVIATSAAMTVSTPATTGGLNGLCWHSMTVSRWTGKLAGTPAVGTANTNTASSTTVTTVAAGSAVVWACADWNAVAPGTPVYRSSATQLGAPFAPATAYVQYSGYQQAASAGSQTFGVSAPTGQQDNMFGIEVQSSGGATVAATTTLSAVASLAPTGVVKELGSATLVAVATVTATGAVSSPGAASTTLAAAGSFGPSATQTQFPSVTMSAAGSFGSSATRTQFATTTMSAVATLSAAGAIPSPSGVISTTNFSHVLANGTTRTVTVPAVTAGNKLVMTCAGGALATAKLTNNTGTAFTLRTTYGGGAQDVSVQDVVVVGGETAVFFTLNGADNVSGTIYEVSGLGAFIGASSNGTGVVSTPASDFHISPTVTVNVASGNAVAFGIWSAAETAVSASIKWRQVGPFGKLYGSGANQPGANTQFVWASGVADVSSTSRWPLNLASAGDYRITSTMITGDMSFVAQALYVNSGVAFVPAAANSTVTENSLPGTQSGNWFLGVNGTNAAIAGYCDKASYTAGSTVNFKVDSGNSAFRVEIYRLGFYGYDNYGARNQLGAQGGYITGTPTVQAAPTVDATLGSSSCAWTTNATWAVPAAATPGVYYVLFRSTVTTTNVAAGLFVVTGSAAGKMAVVLPDLTYQAYSMWGATTDNGTLTYTGRSLYGSGTDGSTLNFAHRAYAVNFDRPYGTQSSLASTYVFDAEMELLSFCEAQGYPMSYHSSLDLDANTTLLNSAALVVFPGHHEYWTTNVYDCVKNAVDAGVNLHFDSSNTALWRTRFAVADTNRRTLICYKDSATRDVSAGFTGTGYDPVTPTGTWRDSLATNGTANPDKRVEDALTGQLFEINGPTSSTTTVPFASKGKPIWRNSASVQALTAGTSYTTAKTVLGNEFDYPSGGATQPTNQVQLNPTSLTFVAKGANPNGTIYTSSPGALTFSFTMYRRASGALVFNTGAWRGWWGVGRWNGNTTPASNGTLDLDWQNALLAVLYDQGMTPQTLRALRDGSDTALTDPATGAPGGTRNNIATAYGLTTGGATLAGVATMTAVASLSATALVTESASVTHAALGSFGSSATRTQFATTTMSAVASLTSTAVVTELGAATLLASAALSGTAVIAEPSAATLSGVATLSAVGGVTEVASSTLSAVAVLSTTGVATGLGSSTLLAVGSVTPTAVVTEPGVAALTATAALTGTALVVELGSATMVAVGSFSTTGAVLSGAASTFMAVATLASSGVVTKPGTAALIAVASLASTSFVVSGTTSTLTAVGTLSPTVTVTENAVATLSAVAALTVTGLVVDNAAAAFTAIGFLSGAATATGSATVTLPAVATFSTAVSGISNATTSMIAVATTSATGGVTELGTAALVATAVLSGTAATATTATSTLTAVAGFATTGLVVESGASALLAAATLSSAGTYVSAGTSTLTAIGSLSATALVTESATVALLAVGVLSTAVSGLSAATATLIAVATTSAAGVPARVSAASLVAAATLTGTGLTTAISAGAFTAVASLAGSALVAELGAATLSGVAVLSASGIVAELALAVLAATASLASTGVATGSGTGAAMTATGVLVGSGIVTQPGLATWVAVATLAVAPSQAQFPLAAFAALGTLSAAGVVTDNASSALLGVAALSAGGATVGVSTSTLIAAATLAATGTGTGSNTSALLAVAVLVANPSVSELATVAHIAVATVAGSAAGTQLSASVLAAAASFTGSGLVTELGAISLVAVAQMTTVGVITQFSTLLATGTLSSSGRGTALGLASLAAAAALTGSGIVAQPAGASLLAVAVMTAGIAAPVTVLAAITVGSISWVVTPGASISSMTLNPGIASITNAVSITSVG